MVVLAGAAGVSGPLEWWGRPQHCVNSAERSQSKRFSGTDEDGTDEDGTDEDGQKLRKNYFFKTNSFFPDVCRCWSGVGTFSAAGQKI